MVSSVAVLLIVLAAAAIWLAERTVHVHAPRLPGVKPAGAETVEVTAQDGTKLRAWLLHPERWRGEAAMVLHGFVDNRAAMLDHARLLLRHGYAVLTPDSRGHGASGGGEVSFGVREAEDVRVWADWLCARLGVDNFVGLGQSMGAAVLISALLRERRLAKVVAESPFTTFREVAFDRLAGRYHLPKFIAWPFAEFALLQVRIRYGFDLNNARPIDAIGVRPVFLIHGAEDRTIAPQHSRRLH
jgi:pimeloyl-ACP methyl ester carboxylesterase